MSKIKGDVMNTYYLRIEAVNLDYSVYDTHDISTIRGGSYMLIDAFKKLEEKMKKELKSISTTASIGLFRVQSDEAEVKRIIDDALTELHSLTGHFGTFVSSYVPAEKNVSFNRTVQELTALCRWQQYQKPSFVLPEASKVNEQCFLDRVRPGTEDEKVGTENKKVSIAVHARRTKGKELRKNLYKSLLGDSFINPITGTEVKFTDELKELSESKEAGILDGKIAFIHIDGNRFGRIRDEICLDEDKYRDLQAKIQEKLRKATLSKIINYAISEKSFQTDENKIRFETLLWGGDEIDWIVPAWQGLQVLQMFFEITNDAEFEGIKLTHAAGVVFCHHDPPILQIRRYANQLCEIAKKDIPKNGARIDNSCNRISFIDLAAKDLISGDINRAIEEYYSPATTDDFLIRSASEDLPKLKENIRIIKRHFPKNKLYDIIIALKSHQYHQVDEIIERTKKIIGQSIWEKVDPAIKEILKDNQNRWLIIADLLDYVGD